SPARCALLRLLERLSLRHKQRRFLARVGALALQYAPESVCRNCAGDCAESPHHQIQAVQQHLTIPNPGQRTCGITQCGVLASVYGAPEYRSQQAQCRASLFQLLACLVNTFIGNNPATECFHRVLDLRSRNAPHALRAGLGRLELGGHRVASYMGAISRGPAPESMPIDSSKTRARRSAEPLVVRHLFVLSVPASKAPRDRVRGG